MIIVIGLFIQREIIRMLEDTGNPIDGLFPYSIGLWVMLFPQLPYAFEIGLGIMLLFISFQTFNSSDTAIKEITTTFFAGLYAPIGLVCLMILRDIGTNIEGFLITMLVVLMVWGNDVFAYFGGKLFGKHPFAPSISPKKTWEGFFSGFVGCLAAAFIMLYLVPYTNPLSFPLTIPLMVLVGIFGPVGDLLESKLKRSANLKDSSTILPGHGGFYDRFDAIILAVPAALIYITIIKELGYVSF